MPWRSRAGPWAVRRYPTSPSARGTRRLPSIGRLRLARPVAGHPTLRSPRGRAPPRQCPAAHRQDRATPASGWRDRNRAASPVRPRAESSKLRRASRSDGLPGGTESLRPNGSAQRLIRRVTGPDPALTQLKLASQACKEASATAGPLRNGGPGAFARTGTTAVCGWPVQVCPLVKPEPAACSVLLTACCRYTLAPPGMPNVLPTVYPAGQVKLTVTSTSAPLATNVADSG